MPGKYHAQGTWWVIVHGISKSQTWLSNWACTCIHILCLALGNKSDPFIADPSIVIISSDPDMQKQMILRILCNWHWGYHINDRMWQLTSDTGRQLDQPANTEMRGYKPDELIKKIFTTQIITTVWSPTNLDLTLWNAKSNGP